MESYLSVIFHLRLLVLNHAQQIFKICCSRLYNYSPVLYPRTFNDLILNLCIWNTICAYIKQRSERDGHTRTPALPPEKPACRAGSSSENQTRNNDWVQIGKGVRQGCILSPCLFNLYAEYIMRNVRLDEAQAGIEIAGRNINNLICR